MSAAAELQIYGEGHWPGPDRSTSLHSCLLIIKCNSFFFCKCSFISSNMRVLKSPSVCHELISIVLAFSLLGRKIFNIAPELGLLDITWLLMIIQKQNDLSPIIISFSQQQDAYAIMISFPWERNRVTPYLCCSRCECIPEYHDDGKP